jgi:hypothetical protein|tara:strand:- start:177 stop:1490 length:1314 start_codon:yes stop_codon:yes gene_type:complete
MAIPELIDALGSFEKQGATMWAADREADAKAFDLAAKTQAAAAKTQAASAQWVAEQQADVYKTMFESSDKLMQTLNTEIAKGTFDIGDLEGAEYQHYKTQWNRRSEAFKQWANALGLPTYDSETDIIALVDAMFEETIRTVDNPRKFLKFGDTKGKWAEVVTRLSPGVNLDLVEIVWNDRYNKLKGVDAGDTSKLGKIPTTGKEWVSEISGALPDLATTALNLPADALATAQGWWEGKDVEPIYQITDPFLGREWWKGWYGAPSRFKPPFSTGEGKSLNPLSGLRKSKDASLSQFEEAAQRRDSANVMLSGVANRLMAGTTEPTSPSPFDRTGQASLIARKGVESLDPLMGPGEGLINGFLAQGTEEDDMPELTRQAINFMTRLAAMMQEYGPEEAMRLMSREFQDLSKSDKAQIEEYLLRRSGRTEGTEGIYRAIA